MLIRLVSSVRPDQRYVHKRLSLSIEPYYEVVEEANLGTHSDFDQRNK